MTNKGKRIIEAVIVSGIVGVITLVYGVIQSANAGQMREIASQTFNEKIEKTKVRLEFIQEDVREVKKDVKLLLQRTR